MPQERPSLEATMTHEVKILYLAAMNTNQAFQDEPYLDMDFFKKYYMEVAHRHDIVFHDKKKKWELSIKEKEDRLRYNLYFGIVRERISQMIKRLKEKKQEAAKKASTEVPMPQVSPLMLPLPPPPTPTEPVQPKLFPFEISDNHRKALAMRDRLHAQIAAKARHR